MPASLSATAGDNTIQGPFRRGLRAFGGGLEPPLRKPFFLPDQSSGVSDLRLAARKRTRIDPHVR